VPADGYKIKNALCMHKQCNKHLMLDKTKSVFLLLSYLAFMMTLQALETSLSRRADLLSEDFLLASGKSMLAIHIYWHYLSVILTAATKEDRESESSLSLLSLKKFAFFKEHSTPASN
jgi:hypothetical protein